MKTRDTRAMAVEAAGRGWIGLHQLWDLACQWTRAGGQTAPKELFESFLKEGQLEVLSAERIGMTTIGVASPSLPPSTPSIVPPGELSGPRYTLRETLGAGGVGQVVAALDREIRRVVALKSLKAAFAGDSRVAARFVEEARITAQLEHPNIVPIYDLGVAPDGEPFYTMRIVKQRSLRDVLEPGQKKQWPTARLVGALLQVSRALAYAHSRGVHHRDIKPENILLGDFGEVYLADWGLAKVTTSSAIRLHTPGSSPPPNVTNAGGTPGYMAPEVIKGDWENVDHRADLFALGVMLYEMLTGKDPFEGNTVETIFVNTWKCQPVRPRDVAPDCPLLLEDLCLSLLARDPAHRPASADEVAQRIEDYLEGAKERERRIEEAGRLCARADEPVRRYHHLESERERLGVQAAALLRDTKGWEPAEKKRPGWALEDLAHKAEREAALVLARAIELYTGALGYDAGCAEAHKGLADLYWARARASATERRLASQVYYEALVTEHDQGTYGAIMKAGARLSLRSNPPGAHVLAQRYFERDRVLVPGDDQYLGVTPVREAKLEPGSYLVTLKAEGFRDVRYPVLLGRGTHHDAGVNLYTDEEIGEGFVYVPAGEAILGGDPEAYESLPRQVVDVHDFAIARFPVTMREYCAFLDHLQATNPPLALRRAPHNSQEGLAVLRGTGGAWEPSPVMIEGEARRMFPADGGHLWSVPALLVDWFDSVAFCRWRGGEETELRLPSETEWEKAARGVDGRFYPWGDRFDPTFCKMRDSRPFMQQPEPNGTFPTDESPYGARDLAGGMREWVADVLGERTSSALLEEPEPSAETERGESAPRQIRSGGWVTDHKWCRSASRGGSPALSRGMALGFRLAKSLIPAEPPTSPDPLTRTSPDLWPAPSPRPRS